jgi:ribonucleotide reductase alpha subunit/intein/homing endonuclease
MVYPSREEQEVILSDDIEELEVLGIEVCEEEEDVYDLHIPQHHAFFTEEMLVSNCGEFAFIDDSACNLASLNLKQFINEEGCFDIDRFQGAVDMFTIAQEIIVDRASYPTRKIATNSHKFRPLGLGYSNLGALLMTFGLPYDSDLGREFCAAVTSLMTARAYDMSARLAERKGAFEGYTENAQDMADVIAKHAKANNRHLRGKEKTGFDKIFRVAGDLWRSNKKREVFRNAQVTLLAPTGCVIGDTMILSSEGILPIQSWEQTEEQWQDICLDIWQEKGKAEATKFYLNGVKPTVRVVSSCGHVLQGTGNHRVRALSPHGKYVWKRLDEIEMGDCLVLSKGGHEDLLGDKEYVQLLGVEDELHPNANPVVLPSFLDERWSEILGYYEGDGYLKERGGLCCVVAEGDVDVVDNLTSFGNDIGCTVSSEKRSGCTVVCMNSYALSRFFVANEWAKDRGNCGQGAASARIPEVVLRSRTSVVRAFLRGLFEADGTVSLVGLGTPHVELYTCSEVLARQVLVVLNSLGIEARLKESSVNTVKGHWGHRLMWRVSISGQENQREFADQIGFMSKRKQALLSDGLRAYKSDMSAKGCCRHMGLLVDIYDRLEGKGHLIRQNVRTRIEQGAFNLAWARALVNEYGLSDSYLARLDADAPNMMLIDVEQVEDGGYQATYDFTVPERNTYVANAFISHNTISFMMDCDTTGIEPDFALVKNKTIAGGGTMRIVNNSITPALRTLGYSKADIQTITECLMEQDNLDGCEPLKPEHREVFACASGEDAINYWGHLKMMAAAQEFLSGSISKCVSGDTLVHTERGFEKIGSWYAGEEPDTFSCFEKMVMTKEGESASDSFYYGGEQRVLRLTLSDGRQIAGTTNHPLWVSNDKVEEWRSLRDIRVGEFVSYKLGLNRWPNSVVDVSGFQKGQPYGSQKKVSLPSQVDEDLGFLFGCMMSEDSMTRSTWTMRVTNNNEDVLKRCQGVVERLFSVDCKRTYDDRGNGVYGLLWNSKTLFEFFEWCGVGGNAETKEIPWVILQSPQEVVSSYLAGLWLDGYVRSDGYTAICIKSESVIRQLQVLLNNFGILSNVIVKRTERYGVFYECGVYKQSARRFQECIELVDEHKKLRLQECVGQGRKRAFTADVVPDVVRGRVENVIRENNATHEYRSVFDKRTNNISWSLADETLRRFTGCGLGDEHYLKVVAIEEDEMEVFDISVPESRSFLANGIVSHNTVNLPESITVEQIEEVYVEAWKMGLKSVALFRDGSKVSPLSSQAHEGMERPIPKRYKLPETCQAVRHKFVINNHEGYINVGKYEDGRPGELFTTMSKQGSTISGLMDAFSIAVSLLLQHGVPLDYLVDKFAFTRFEPSGWTPNKDIPNARSPVDYIFRWMSQQFDHESKNNSNGVSSDLSGLENRYELNRETGERKVDEDTVCKKCGHTPLTRTGNCYTCPSCGETSGCS